MGALTTPFGTNFSPLLGEPRMGLVPIPNKVATLLTLTTGGGVVTGTAAQILGGLLVLNTTNAQTYTLPTAALLNAAVPAAQNGAAFDFDVINTGPSTATIAVGTGGTLATGSNSKNTVATVATLNAQRFTILITGVLKNGDTSDTYTVFGYGNVAAAVA